MLILINCQICLYISLSVYDFMFIWVFYTECCKRIKNLNVSDDINGVKWLLKCELFQDYQCVGKCGIYHRHPSVIITAWLSVNFHSCTLNLSTSVRCHRPVSAAAMMRMMMMILATVWPYPVVALCNVLVRVSWRCQPHCVTHVTADSANQTVLFRITFTFYTPANINK